MTGDTVDVCRMAGGGPGLSRTRFGDTTCDSGAPAAGVYDHIIPVAKGGGNSAENVQLLCGDCNRQKSDHIV